MRRFTVLLVGVIFLAVGVFLLIKNNTLARNCTTEAEATVVDMKQEFSTDNDTGYLYYPILEYNAGGETVRVTMDSGSDTPAYEIDQKLTVLYNPQNIKQFIVKGENSGSIFSIVFMVLGVAVTAYGIKVAIKKEG